MPKPEPFLSVRLEGASIGAGRVGVSHLMRLLGNLNKALLRTGQVIQGEADMWKGRRGKSLKEEIEPGADSWRLHCATLS